VTLRHIAVLALGLLAAAAHAQTGAADLRTGLLGLGTTLRVLEITAHPGDEDGALLICENRVEGAQVALLTLTRGERGTNLQGVMEPSAQGLLRTMEQLSADAHYGAEQRFTRVVDFGFARTADEVFDRWGGHNIVLGDMVRVIRELRPAVIVTPFDPDAPDGDGQHQATALLVREAFRAAADPRNFPEQLNDGLQPWQAKRLFALSRSPAYTVRLNAGEVSRGEHESWQRQADAALSEERSQQGIWHAPRELIRNYRLIEAASGFSITGSAYRLTQGLDTSLEPLADAAGLEFGDRALARTHLAAMQKAAAEAARDWAFRDDCTAQLGIYLRNLRAVESYIAAGHPPAWLTAELAEKRRQAENALLSTWDVHLKAELSGDEKGAGGYVLVPGEEIEVHAHLDWAQGAHLRVAGIDLKPEGGRWTPSREWLEGSAQASFIARVPNDAPFTRPQFLLEYQEDGAYRILDEHNATRALPPPSVQVAAVLEVAGEPVTALAAVSGRDAGGIARTAVVAPPVSVVVEPRTQWNRRTQLAYGELEARVRSNLPILQNALLTMHAPRGWRVEPEHEVLDIRNRGEEHTYRFYIIQERGEAGSVPISAVVRWGGLVFDQGYTVVRDSDDRVAFDYRASTGSLVSADIEIPENLEIGYIGVDGDSIPDALAKVDVRVVGLNRDQLMQGELAKFWAIVIGPHALDAKDDPGEARSRLLHYVEGGGVVVILAQCDAPRFVRNAPLPFPLELGAARVTNAAAAVEVVDRSDLFIFPNEVSEDDWSGWIGERASCLAAHWDPRFEPLLRMADAGQPKQSGALLRARYGRGTVIYSALSFSRQLSAGTPGAMRLLINLLSPAADLHR
jgi:LmbE family N-acetylglucosaminyl deacetylase